MTHSMRLHKKTLVDALQKRVPYPTPAPEPDPGLLGDLLGGVGSIANNAVSGVVGLVTTVLGDVNALVAPAKATATKTSSSSNVPVTTTAAPGSTSSPTSSSGNNAGSNGGSSGGNGSSNGSGSNSNSGSSNSNGSSNGSNGNGSNGNGSNSNGSNGSGSSGNGSNGSGSSGNGSNGNSNASGANSEGAGSPDGDGSTNNGSEVSGTEELVGGSVTLSGSDTNAIGSTPSASISRSEDLDLAEGTASALGIAATASPVVNVVGSINSEGSESPSASALSSGARGTATISGRPLSTNTTTGSNGDGNGNGASSENGNHGLSPGVITAIVVVSSLALLAFIILALRRWYRKRRARRFETWASHPGAFAFFGAASVNVNNEKDEKSARSGSGTRSARSSFGTTYDQGIRSFTPEPLFVPSATTFSDFYAGTNNTSMTFPTPSPAPGTVVPTVQRPENAVNRQSLISVASSSSSSYGSGENSGPRNTSTEAVVADREGSTDDHGQCLIVPESHGPDRPQPSPISVRPWSPSESWAFPKPPTNTAQKSIFYQPPASPVSQSAHIEYTPASNLPPLSPFTAERDPFADPTQSGSEVQRSSVASMTTEGAVTVHTTASGADGGVVGAVEYIRRQFIPTLVDELKVHRGDVIRVLQAFDDGWVQVEKLSSADDSNVASSSGAASPVKERGLIPVDCLREAGEALPAFVASRRLSSYYGGGVAL